MTRQRTAEALVLNLELTEAMAWEREECVRALASRVGRITAEAWVNDALEDLAGYRGIAKLSRQRDILEHLLRDSFRRLAAYQRIEEAT